MAIIDMNEGYLILKDGIEEYIQESETIIKLIGLLWMYVKVRIHRMVMIPCGIPILGDRAFKKTFWMNVIWDSISLLGNISEWWK